MKHLLIHAWALYRVESEFFIPYAHWIYLREIGRYFDRITLLSPVKEAATPLTDMPKVSDAVSNFHVIEVPWYNSYAAAMRLYFKFRAAYRQAGDCTHCYVRYPVPFGWMCRDHFERQHRIIHFVGDPVDTVNSNNSLSPLSRFIKTSAFVPEFQRYISACKSARVFTNGLQIKTKLDGYGINATSLTSSTLLESDFYFDPLKRVDPERPRILYAGYLRRAKGLDTMLDAFVILSSKYPGAHLTIAGDGEMRSKLEARIAQLQLQDRCTLTGHIEDRHALNALMRSHDVFLFTSVSEGSPRAVLEAMANGLPVVTTRVGSLPQSFSNETDLLFANIGDAQELANQVIRLITDPHLAFNIRQNAFNIAKQHTLQTFIQRIFGEA